VKKNILHPKNGARKKSQFSDKLKELELSAKK
jgi:ribosomal protein S20